MTRAGEVIALPGHSFDFLIALVKAAPNIANAEFLIDEVWRGRFASPEAISQRAKMVRDALGDDSQNPRYFEAVRGHGYRLLAEVKSRSSSPEASPGRWRTAALFGAGVLALALLASLDSGNWFQQDPPEKWLPESYYAGVDALQLETAAGIHQALEHFSEALVQRPDLAEIHVGLANARLSQARYRLLNRDVALRLADDAIDKALALDPELATAFVARGNLLGMKSQNQAAEQAFRNAIELDPGLAEAYVDYGFMLLSAASDPTRHRPYETIDLWRRAARLDPGSDSIRARLAWTEFRAGNFDTAEATLRDILKRKPDLPTAHFVLAELLGGSGRQADAIHHYRTTLTLNTYFSPLAFQGLIESLVDLGLDVEAREVLALARTMPDSAGLVPALELFLAIENDQPRIDDPEYLRTRVVELASFNPSWAAWYDLMLNLLAGDHAKARLAVETSEPRLAEPPGSLPVDGYWRMLFCPYAHTLIQLGEIDQGEAMAGWLLQRMRMGPDFARRRHVNPMLCHAALGQVDKAVAVFTAVEGVPAGWRFLSVRPDLSELHAEPDFANAIDQVRAEARRQRDMLAGSAD